jgi:hypothetical protein
MQCSKSLGYLGYPLLTFFLAGALSMQAQTQSEPQRSAPPAQSTAPANETQQPTELQPAPAAPAAVPQAQQPQENSSSQPQRNYPNEQERVRLAQEAQARVRARRAARTAAVVKDTYTHKYEIYFGYNYLRMRPGHDLQHGNEYGWNAGMTRLFSQKLGVSLDLHGYYKSVYVGNNPYGLNQPFISNYSALVGPQYWVRQRKNYAVSFQGLAGVTRNLFYANSAKLPGTYVGLYPNATKFAAAAVMPVDFNLGPGLAVRIAPIYHLTTWGDDIQHNLGFTTGLTYRWGRQ